MTTLTHKIECRTANSRLPQVAVLWLIEGSCFYQSLVQVDSCVLRNRHLRQPANRYEQFEED